MNQARDELTALVRITKLIKSFCQQADDPSQISKPSIDVFLKEQLLPQDWTFWEQLQEYPGELRGNNQTPLVDYASSSQRFKFLIGQYRRAGLEFVQHCCQIQKSSFNTTDPF